MAAPRKPKAKPVATIDALLAADKPKEIETVELPELGVSVRVAGFTHSQSSALFEQMLDENGEPNQDRANDLTLHYGLVEPALTVEQAGEFRATTSSATVGRIINAIDRLNGHHKFQGDEQSFRSGAGSS